VFQATNDATAGPSSSRKYNDEESEYTWASSDDEEDEDHEVENIQGKKRTRSEPGKKQKKYRKVRTKTIDIEHGKEDWKALVKVTKESFEDIAPNSTVLLPPSLPNFDAPNFDPADHPTYLRQVDLERT
jgi:hypothetical protein